MTADKAKDKDKAKPVIDADVLRAEVKAFASSLGFGSSGGAFEYDDFAPEKAAKKIKPSGQQSSKQPGAEQPAKQSGKHHKQADAARARDKQQDTRGLKQQQDSRHKGREQQQQQQQQQQQEEGRQQLTLEEHRQLKKQQQQQDNQNKNLDAVRSRTWVESVGPRPGEVRGRSLLGKDEPTIWYEAAASLPRLDPGSTPPLVDDASETLRQRAEALLEREGQLFEKEMAGRNASDARWLAQVRRSGTTADKVAAMSLLVNSSATANIKSLDGLLALMSKSGGGRQVVTSAMEALQELFLTNLLPDRKLRVLEQQPLQVLPPGKDGERCLLLWGVEDAVKRRYQQYVQLLEKCSTADLDFIKEKATKAISRLLQAKPEGEQALLAALVNKLGDPARKLASDAGYMLGQLLLEHPAMKSVVVREVERFMFRPGLTDRARYYGVTFLNQLALSHRPQEGGSALAAKLIDIYFSLFKLLLEGKLGNAAARQQQDDDKHHGKGGKGHSRGGKAGSAGHKGKGSSGFGFGNKGRGGGGQNKGAGRGGAGGGSRDGDGEGAVQQAGELDARMLSALITGVRRAFPYVDAEKAEPLIEAHSEKLFTLVHTAPFTVSLQALMLMHQLLSGRNAVSDRFYRALYAVLLTEGARGASGVRAPQFMSLLVKAMRGDVSVKRVAAFAKRLLQVACHAPSNWAAGALLLLSEVLRAQPGLWAAVQQPEDAAGQAETFQDVPAAAAGMDGFGGDDDDDEEVFRDVVGSEGEEGEGQGQKGAAAGYGAAGKGSSSKAAAEGNGAAGAAADGAAAAAAATKWPREDYYDMRKREPLYASAEVSCWWELLLLSRHAHPSVAAFARSLLAGSPVEYTGDPLRDLGLPAFLDKFVNKKPKATPRGTSLMQPTHSLAAAAAAAGGSDAAAAAGSAARTDVAVLGGDAFAALAEADISADQLFFHRFFNLQSVKSKQSASAKAKAQRAAAAAASGLGEMSGLASDDDDEPGELRPGRGDVASDDLDDAEVDRALAEAEGMGDDELGDPDIGWNYDQLLEAMAGDGGSSGSGSEGEGDGSDAEGAEEGTASEEGGEADGSEQEGEDEEAGRSGSDGAEEGPSSSRSGGSSSSSGGSDDEEDEMSDGEDWVMLEGADQAAAAAAAAGSSKKKKRKLDAAAGDGEDAELQDVNVFDLPSPSSSEGDGEQQQQQQQRRKKQKQQQQQADEGSGSDLDLDLDDIISGDEEEDDAMVMSEDSDEVAAAGGGSSSTDEEAEPPPAAAAAATAGSKGKQKQQKNKRGKGGALFADADGYQSYFEEYEKTLAAAAEEKDEAAGAAAAGDGDAGRGRGMKGAGSKRRQGGSSKQHSKRQSR